MDFLGLRTLTVIQDTIDLVKANKGVQVEFDNDMNDPKVYKLWQDGNSVGIFQFESQGMTNFMKELKPDCLEDIIAGVSLYRPGPMDQIPRYIANKKDPEHAVYTHPALKPILKVTYGCMVYQEQVMQIVRDLAGYSLGRADLVRRAMGKKKLDVMAREREIFINGQLDEDGNIVVPGCVRNGIDAESANRIFDEMAEFAKYAFNKSHAAAYAVVSYRTAYLKAYYPAEFMAATLNSFLGNLDKIPDYIEECRRLNISILKPDINRSYTKFTVDNEGIRFGLGSIKNVGTSAVDEIVKERTSNGEFKNFADFCERIKDLSVNKKCVESLIKSGAFDCFEQTRSTLIASYETIIDTISNSNKKSFDGQVSMFDLTETEDEKINEIKYNYTVFPEYSEKEMLFMEKEMLGIYISGHPLEKIKNQLEMQTTINTYQIKKIKEDIEETGMAKYEDNQMVKYAGIITSVKKKYTKTNKLMAFVTVEDMYGTTEVIIFENCYQNCSNILVEDNIILVEGRLSVREDEDTKIVARDIKEFAVQKKKILSITITNLDEKHRNQLKGAIKFFSGDKNNIQIQIINGEEKNFAGGIYLTTAILKELQDIVGEANISVKED
jgi:DNA polymerase III, alpha subunit